MDDDDEGVDSCAGGTVLLGDDVCMGACGALEEGDEDGGERDAAAWVLSRGAPSSAWLIKKLIHSSARLSP